MGTPNPSFHPRRGVIPYPDRPGLFSWRVVGGRLTERCGQEGGMTPDCRHDGNQLAPGALGAQPAAHLPPRARSVTQGVVENGYALVFSVLSPPPPG